MSVDIMNLILNKKPDDVFFTGNISSLNPLQVKIYSQDNGFTCKATSSLTGLKIGSNVVLLKLYNQFIVMAVIDAPMNNGTNYNLLEWLDYAYLNNENLIDMCQSGWINYYNGSTITETDKTFIQANSIVHVCPAGTGWSGGSQKTISATNLTTFNNGQTSTTNDYIVVQLYISDISKFDHLYIHIGTDMSNCYVYDCLCNTYFTNNGYQVLCMKKSAFTVSGSPNWNNVTWICFQLHSISDPNGHYVSTQFWGMIRKHSTLDKPWVFQRYNGSAWISIDDYDFNGVTPALIFETGATKPTICILDHMTNMPKNALILSKYWRNFYLVGIMICKRAGITPAINWYIDANNWISVYYYNSYYYLKWCVNGTVTEQSINIGLSILKNDVLSIMITKVNGFIKCRTTSNVSSSYINIPDPFGNSYGHICISKDLNNTPTGQIKNLMLSNDSYIWQESGYDIV